MLSIESQLCRQGSEVLLWPRWEVVQTLDVVAFEQLFAEIENALHGPALGL